MREFKVGDRVKLVNLDRFDGGQHDSSYLSNTVGNVGVVTLLYKAGDYTIGVDWDNGSSNRFAAHNLRPLAMENV